MKRRQREGENSPIYLLFQSNKQLLVTMAGKLSFFLSTLTQFLGELDQPAIYLINTGIYYLFNSLSLYSFSNINYVSSSVPDKGVGNCFLPSMSAQKGKNPYNQILHFLFFLITSFYHIFHLLSALFIFILLKKQTQISTAHPFRHPRDPFPAAGSPDYSRQKLQSVESELLIFFSIFIIVTIKYPQGVYKSLSHLSYSSSPFLYTFC